MFCCLYAPGNLPILMDCARRFSPLIEEHSDLVVFDVRGLNSLYGPLAALARAIQATVGGLASIAFADNPDAAIHAGKGIRGTTVIAAGAEAAILAPLPINLLGGAPEVARSLDLWGVRTFGAFAALPANGVAARLGHEGIALQELARGQRRRQLRPKQEPQIFASEMDLESPVELLESLCFVLSRLLEEVIAELSAHGLATNEVRVTLSLERNANHSVTLRLPVPTVNARTLLKMLHLQLSENPPPCSVVKVRLTAEPARPRRTQHGLFAALPPEPERLEVTLARVRHLVGADNVGSPWLGDTHRSDSFVMRPFNPPQRAAPPIDTGTLSRMYLRRLRPPSYADVLLQTRKPVRISSSAAVGRIATAAGPWRSSGDWWADNPWWRDRWDVELESGVVLRIFEEIDSHRWFVEGIYD